MRRREFITLLGGAAAAWPMAARAQQTMPVIGFLRNTSAAQSLVAAFRQGLKEAGYEENQNVTVEYRWADNHNERMPALAAELVQRRVSVILAGGNPAVFAAKAATKTIPIVFATGADPVSLGLVPNLNNPGGNITGVTFLSTSTFVDKRVEFLSGLLPANASIAFLANPNTQNGAEEIRKVKSETTGRPMAVLNASSEQDLEDAFKKLVQVGAAALVVGGDALFLSRRELLVELAARYRIPTSYQLREYVVAGGLMSYGASISDTYRQGGIYAGRIIGGAKPGDLPVMQPTKYELVINLKTAKALGLEFPPNLIALADEVIE